MEEVTFDVTVYPPNGEPKTYFGCPEVRTSEDSGFVLFTTREGVHCKTNLPIFSSIHAGE